MKVLFQHFIRFLANTFNITPSFFSGWDQTQGLMYTKPVFYRQHLQMYLKYNLCVFMSLQVYMWGGTCMCVCKGLCVCVGQTLTLSIFLLSSPLFFQIGSLSNLKLIDSPRLPI